MDILTRSADFVWNDFLGELSPVLAMFFMRWGLLLLCLMFCGLMVRFLLAPGYAHTLHLQTLGIVLAGFVAFAIPLSSVASIRNEGRPFLLFVSLGLFLAAPYFTPPLLIRRRGIQGIVRVSLYVAEFVLLGLQLLVMPSR